MVNVSVIVLAALLFLTPTRSHGEEDKSSPVDLLMEQMSRDMKKLSRQVENPASRDKSLSLADGLIDATNEAKALKPESAGQRTGQELADYLALYQKGLDALAEQFQILKKAIESEDIAAAEIALEEAWALRERYHRDLRLDP